MNEKLPQRGEVWFADFEPVRGHEQGGHRPCLILSVDEFNNCPAELAIVLPITTKRKSVGTHVEIRSTGAGLKGQSVAKCEDIRSISLTRFGRKLGRVASLEMATIEDRVRMLLGL